MSENLPHELPNGTNEQPDVAASDTATVPFESTETGSVVVEVPGELIDEIAKEVNKGASY